MSRRTRLYREIRGLLKDDITRPYSVTRKARGGRVSEKTIKDRRDFFKRMCRILYQKGYRLQKAHNLSAKHVDALIEHWEERGLQANTVQNYLSILRMLLEKLDKPQLMWKVDSYGARLADQERNGATDEGDVRKRSGTKGWVGQGIDPERVIRAVAEVDSLVALQLCLMKEFGLRVREAHRLRPAESLKENAIIITRGTKGRRVRSIKNLSESQRELLEHAAKVARHIGSKGSMMPSTYREPSWRRYYYHVLAKVGVTRRQLGITSHGLRHDYAQKRYRDETGEPAPVISALRPAGDGATGIVDLQARRLVASELGHGRYDITRAYLDSMEEKGRLRIRTTRRQRGLRKNDTEENNT